MAGAGLLIAGVLLAVGMPLEAFLAAAFLFTAALALERWREPIVVFVCLSIMIGLALSALVEHMVLSGDIGRMNTVFKFYLQIWLLWGTCAAGALAAIVSRWGAARRPVRRERSLPLAAARALGRWSFATATAVLAAAALLYTALGTPARLRDRFDEKAGPSLDGGAFLATATHYDQRPLELRWDGEAFQWLRENVIGNPVLLEASVPPYRWGSRVSMFTGLPTVLGWDWHQKQQRSIRRSDPVGRRLRDIEQIYSSPDAAAIVPLLKRYAVELVYVGQVERAYYPEEGLRKFAASPELFAPLYSNDEVQIYRVVDDAPPAAPPLVRGPAAARGGVTGTG
jgi:YYY domain-containing protein